jgi:uncharacterized protein (TIGR01777 family)
MGGDRMHVIIAGGSGLIGRQLTMNLTAAGDEVTILSRYPQNVLGLPKGAKAVEWDGKTLQDWGKLIENSDAVVNLTGENLSGKGLFPSRWSEERKSRLLQSRVNSGAVLTQAIKHAKTKPSVFIQASGINYYGTQGDKPVTEADAAGNDFLANLSKEWEASSQPVESLGIRRVVVRNGIVLSTKAGALPIITLPYRLYVGGPLGNGRQVFSWIHLADEVSAIQFLLHNPQAHGAFNLTSPNPVTNDEFGKTIGKVLHRPHYFKIPGFAMRLAFGEVAMMVLEGIKVMPQKLLAAGFEYRFPLLEDALRELLIKSEM